MLVNALKLVRANAERMLALCFNCIYDCSKDAFRIFRGLLQLPGIIRAIDPDRVEVVRPARFRKGRRSPSRAADRTDHPAVANVGNRANPLHFSTLPR
jgi:hypothetical protein